MNAEQYIQVRFMNGKLASKEVWRVFSIPQKKSGVSTQVKYHAVI